jgi:hypothetical protein
MNNPVEGHRRLLLNATFAAAGVGLILVFIALRQPRTPVFEGKPISAWFEQLCCGILGGSSEAYNAFTRMTSNNSNAVPYLVGRLTYLRASRTEKVVLWLKRNWLTGPFAKDIILPNTRRCYAAVALQRMGPSASSAVPALLEAWKLDIREVQVNCVAALAAILYGRVPADGLSPSDWMRFESQTVADAARAFPEAARRLKIAVPQAIAVSSNSTDNVSAFPKGARVVPFNYPRNWRRL